MAHWNDGQQKYGALRLVDFDDTKIVIVLSVLWVILEHCIMRPAPRQWGVPCSPHIVWQYNNV